MPGADAPAAPTSDHALAVANHHGPTPAVSAERFPTGLHHWVYDVRHADGSASVVRLTLPEQRAHFAGALFWHERLRPLGVPLAEIRHSDLDPGGEPTVFPYLVLERLPGQDLGLVHAGLDREQRRGVAEAVARAQRTTARLPAGRGFGYALDDRGEGLAHTWPQVLHASLARARRWIERAGCFEPAVVDRVSARLEARLEALADVKPAAFLHDTTTKNVIVDEGRMTGIVDVDSIAYGDVAWAIALTEMALLSQGEGLDYVDAWCNAAEFDDEMRERVHLYAAVHGCYFIGELGQRWNRESAEPVDRAHGERLEALVEVLSRGRAPES